MLVKFTINGGVEPVSGQARSEVLEDRLAMLRQFDPSAESTIRTAIRSYLRTHTEFTAAHIACAGDSSEWYSEFWPLYDALAEANGDPERVREEAAKFLGLIVWNEALNDSESWHFTSYPKVDTDFMVTHYFAVDGHIRAKAKLNQAASARAYGDYDRASDFEGTARRLMGRWRR